MQKVKCPIRNASQGDLPRQLSNIITISTDHGYLAPTMADRCTQVDEIFKNLFSDKQGQCRQKQNEPIEIMQIFIGKRVFTLDTGLEK